MVVSVAQLDVFEGGRQQLDLNLLVFHYRLILLQVNHFCSWVLRYLAFEVAGLVGLVYMAPRSTGLTLESMCFRLLVFMLSKIRLFACSSFAPN